MATVANQIPTQNIGGLTYYQSPDGKWYDGRGVPLEQEAPDYSTGSQFEQGVTATDPISGYVSNYNPLQYATEETTQRLGSQLGLPTGETRMEFSDASAPQRNVGGLNAGLVQDTINRYGPATPGSYSEYLIKRDLQQDTSQGDYANYNNYYNSAPVKQAMAAVQPATAPGTTKANPVPPGTGAGTYTGGIGQGAPGAGFGSPTTPTPTGRGSGVTPTGTVGPPAWSRPTSPVVAQPPAPSGAPPPPPPPATPGTGAPPPANRPPYVPPTQGPGIPGGGTGSAQPPIGNYQPRATPQSFRSNPTNAYPNVTPTYAKNGEDIQYASQEDRNLALQRGEELNADLGEYADQQYQEAGDFSDLQGAAYSGIAAGQGGRSGDEKDAILRQNELNSLQQTEGEADSNYLTGAEEAGIRGDTGAAYRQLGKDEAGIDTASLNRDQYARGEFNRGRDATLGALDTQDAGVRGAVGRQRELSNATLVGEANNARKYLDPTALNTSDEYNNTYNFGERDMQDIVDKAGRTVGYGATADEDRLLRDANAQGNTSPLALQAARDRIRQTGAVSSADAMTDARIAAKQLQLQTAQGKENTRLGAAQNYANLGTGTELNLGDDAMRMQDTLGAAEIGAESYLGDARTKAQMSLGQQGTQLEKDLGQSHIDIGTKGAEMNLAAGQAKDAADSARAGQIATNRQAATKTNQDTRYGRGMDIYGKESAANTDFSNARRADEQEYRKTLADRQAQAAQGTQVGNSTRVGAYGTQSGAVNAAEGNRINNASQKGLGEKIAGMFLKYGGEVEGQDAIVGEAGPEIKIDLARLPRYGDGGLEGVEEADDIYHTPLSPEVQEFGYQRRKNPLYEQILKQTFAIPGAGGYGQTQEQPQQSAGIGNKIVGGLVSKGLGLIGLADGGVVDGELPNYLDEPPVELIDHPQVRRLGQNGPTAIIPMTRRPQNRLNPEDIPELVSQYGNYGRPQPMARGGMVGCGGYGR